MATTMIKRVVINSSLYYDENIVNYAAVHTDDNILLHSNCVEIANKCSVFEFEVIVHLTVTSDTTLLNSFQRKYHLKDIAPILYANVRQVNLVAHYSKLLMSDSISKAKLVEWNGY